MKANKYNNPLMLEKAIREAMEICRENVFDHHEHIIPRKVGNVITGYYILNEDRSTTFDIVDVHF